MPALEKALGAELFHRLPRGYELSERGTALLNETGEIEAQVDPLVREAGRSRRTLVKISAGTWMTRVLCERAPSLLGDGDAIALRFISAEHVLDIARREAVIGIRNRRPEQPGLACRRVCQVRFAGYALGEGIGSWARVVETTPSALWLAANTGPTGRIEVTSPQNALDLALAGVAREVLPTFIGDALGGLARVTPPIVDLTHDQWLVTHREKRFVPEVAGRSTGFSLLSATCIAATGANGRSWSDRARRVSSMKRSFQPVLFTSSLRRESLRSRTRHGSQRRSR